MTDKWKNFLYHIGCQLIGTVGGKLVTLFCLEIKHFGTKYNTNQRQSSSVTHGSKVLITSVTCETSNSGPIVDNDIRYERWEYTSTIHSNVGEGGVWKAMYLCYNSQLCSIKSTVEYSCV